MRELLIVCPLVFLAALVDSVAGGGGLISLPAYYLAGLPPHMALGTNKLSSSISATVSTARFVKSGCFHLPTAATGAAFALAGSALGVKLALVLSERVLQIILMAALPLLAAFLFTRGRIGDDKNGNETLPLPFALPVSAASGLVIGAYDGFFGPGTGTFLILCYYFFVRLDLRSSMGNAKIINLASNISALLTFGLNGKLIPSIGVPAALCGMLGGYIGSGLALKNGAKIFRPILGAVMALLLAKVAYDFIRAGL